MSFWHKYAVTSNSLLTACLHFSSQGHVNLSLASFSLVDSLKKQTKTNQKKQSQKPTTKQTPSSKQGKAVLGHTALAQSVGMHLAIFSLPPVEFIPLGTVMMDLPVKRANFLLRWADCNFWGSLPVNKQKPYLTPLCCVLFYIQNTCHTYLFLEVKEISHHKTDLT